MATDWIMVRIARRTHAELERVRQSMLLAHDVGLRELETDTRDRVSLDQVIRLLIEMRDRHAERRRRSAAARRRRPASAEPAEADQLAGLVDQLHGLLAGDVATRPLQE